MTTEENIDWKTLEEHPDWKKVVEERKIQQESKEREQIYINHIARIVHGQNTCPTCGHWLEKWAIDKKAHPEQDRESYYCPECDCEMIFGNDGSIDVVS